MSEEQSLKSEKKSESEASVPGEKTEEREGREGALLSLHNRLSGPLSCLHSKISIRCEDAACKQLHREALRTAGITL